MKNDFVKKIEIEPPDKPAAKFAIEPPGVPRPTVPMNDVDVVSGQPIGQPQPQLPPIRQGQRFNFGAPPQGTEKCTVNIGKPLRTIIVEPLELPTDSADPEPDVDRISKPRPSKSELDWEPAEM